MPFRRSIELLLVFVTAVLVTASCGGGGSAPATTTPDIQATIEAAVAAEVTKQAPTPTPPPTPIPTPTPAPTPLPLTVAVLTGRVVIDGRPAPKGTLVVLVISGRPRSPGDPAPRFEEYSGVPPTETVTGGDGLAQNQYRATFNVPPPGLLSTYPYVAIRLPEYALTPYSRSVVIRPGGVLSLDFSINVPVIKPTPTPGLAEAITRMKENTG